MFADWKQTSTCCIVLLSLTCLTYKREVTQSFIVFCIKLYIVHKAEYCRIKLSYVLNSSAGQYPTKRVIPLQLTAGQPDQPQLPVSCCRDGWTSAGGETNKPEHQNNFRNCNISGTGGTIAVFLKHWILYINSLSNTLDLTWESLSCTHCPSSARLSRGHKAQMALSKIRDRRSTMWDRLACSAWGRGAQTCAMTRRRWLRKVKDPDTKKKQR